MSVLKVEVFEGQFCRREREGIIKATYIANTEATISQSLKYYLVHFLHVNNKPELILSRVRALLFQQIERGGWHCDRDAWTHRPKSKETRPTGESHRKRTYTSQEKPKNNRNLLLHWSLQSPLVTCSYFIGDISSPRMTVTSQHGLLSPPRGCWQKSLPHEQLRTFNNFTPSVRLHKHWKTR